MVHRLVGGVIAAVATPGDRPGPWLTPIVTDKSAIKHRAGLVTLASVSTSRVLCEFHRAVLGWPGMVADIRNDQQPALERFTATEAAGPIVEVGVRPTGKPETWGPTFWAYGVRESRVLGWRMDMAATTTQLRWGPGASHMRLSDHPALAHIRTLGLKPRGVIGSFHTDGTRVIDRPHFDVGPSHAPPPVPAAVERPSGRFTVGGEDGTERAVHVDHVALGINPAGDFVPTPLGPNHWGTRQLTVADRRNRATGGRHC